MSNEAAASGHEQQTVRGYQSDGGGWPAGSRRSWDSGIEDGGRGSLVSLLEGLVRLSQHRGAALPSFMPRDVIAEDERPFRDPLGWNKTPRLPLVKTSLGPSGRGPSIDTQGSVQHQQQSSGLSSTPLHTLVLARCAPRNGQRTTSTTSVTGVRPSLSTLGLRNLTIG